MEKHSSLPYIAPRFQSLLSYVRSIGYPRGGSILGEPRRSHPLFWKSVLF